MMNSLYTSAAIVISLLFGTAGASAATIDFTDGIYSNAHYDLLDGQGPVDSFTESTADGTFTFATTGQFRYIGPWGGDFDPAGTNERLEIGGGGGSPSAFTMTTSEDIYLTSFLGIGQLYNTNPIFDVTGTTTASIANTFGSEAFYNEATSGVANDFNSGPLFLAAGTTATFTVANSSASARGYLTGLEYSTSLPAVPLPAGMPLLLGGLAAFGLHRFRLRGLV